LIVMEILSDTSVLVFASVLIAGTVFLLTLINTDAAIVLLIIAMLFSPEIGLASVPGRSVVIRFDDLLLLVIFFSWLAKLAINKQLGLLKPTPMNVPVSIYIGTSLISSVLGMLRGNVTSPVASIFYLLKGCEYFLLYFMIVNVVQYPAQVKLYLRVLLLTAAAVGIFSYFQIASHGPGYRISAPFEGKAEPNTLAGYLVFIVAQSIAQVLCNDSRNSRVRQFALSIFLLPPLIFTYSRGGYLSFISMYIMLIFLSSRHRFPLASLLLVGALLAPIVLPHTVFDRLHDTFGGGHESMMVGNVRLAHSPAARVKIYKYVVEKWSENPLFGLGITGIGFVDTQYGLLIGEVGILGLLAFLFMNGRLWMVTFDAYRKVQDGNLKGICLGFLAGQIGMLIHSFSGNVFLIVRIMEPFWFIAALITVLPHVQEVAKVLPPPKPRLPRPGMVHSV